MTHRRRRGATSSNATPTAASTGQPATVRGVPGVLRLLAALAWPGIRTARVAIILVPAGAGLLLEVLMVVGRARVDASIQVDLVRILALVGVVGVAFMLEDEAVSFTAVQPVTYALRCAARLLIVVPALIAWWAVVLILSGHIAAQPATPLPGWGLSVEGTTLTAVAVLVAGWPRRRSEHRIGALVAASVVTACTGILRALPSSWPLLPAPTDPRWLPVHRGWAVAALAVAGAAMITVAERPSVAWAGWWRTGWWPAAGRRVRRHRRAAADPASPWAGDRAQTSRQRARRPPAE